MIMDAVFRVDINGVKHYKNVFVYGKYIVKVYPMDIKSKIYLK